MARAGPERYLRLQFDSASRLVPMRITLWRSFGPNNGISAVIYHGASPLRANNCKYILYYRFS